MSTAHWNWRPRWRQAARANLRTLTSGSFRASACGADARALHLALLRDVRKGALWPRLEALVLDNLSLDEKDCGNYASVETDFNHGLSTLAAGPEDDPILAGPRSHLLYG
jgi:hypothetical protein